MGSSTLIIILVIVAVLAFVFLRGINPESKTDSQIRILHAHTLRAGDLEGKGLAKIEEEMKKRGILGESGNIERTSSSEGHLVQLEATKLRDAARTSYIDGWNKAKAKGKSERICHESGLTNALFMRLQAGPNRPPVTEELFRALMLEQIPFNIMEHESGKEAMAEYVVWREHPELANEAVIKNAVEALKTHGFDESMPSNPKGSLGWIPWSKFL